MLCPMYRKCGVELTRYLASEDAVWGMSRRSIRAHLNTLLSVENLEALSDEFKSNSYFVDGANLIRRALTAVNNSDGSETIEKILRRVLLLDVPKEEIVDPNELDELHRELVVMKLEFKSSQLSTLNEGFRLLDKRFRRLFNDFDSDPQCYEVSSVPLKTWGKLHKFFAVADEAMATAGCLRHSDHVTGAAGHIHIQVTGWEAYRVLRALLDHPWVMMAFDDPRNCQAPLSNCREKQFDETFFSLAGARLLDYSETFFSKSSETRSEYAHPDIIYQLPNLRMRAPVTWRAPYGTLEYRLFDVAQTWEMQEEHMAFAQAFTEWALNQPLVNRPMMREEVERLTVKQCQQGFRNLIEMLGLPWKRYRWYAQTNIPTRAELGTLNFNDWDVQQQHYHLDALTAVPARNLSAHLATRGMTTQEAISYLMENWRMVPATLTGTSFVIDAAETNRSTN